MPESAYDNKFFHYFGQNEQNYSHYEPIPQPNPNERDHLSDLFYRNKLLPGLAGWVSLDKPKAEKNELDLIDINYIREENNENIDFHLKKFFEEEDNQFKLSPMQNSAQIPSMNAHKRHTPISGSKKIATGPTFKPTMPSFFENLDNSLNEFIENSNLSQYSEFTRQNEIMSNLDNFFFIEQNHNFSGTKHFLNNYVKLIERLKNSNDNNKLTLKLLVQVMASFSVDLVSELFKFIKGCDKSFCFDELKNKQPKKDNPSNLFSNPTMSQQDSSFAMSLGMKENESVFNFEASKNGRKVWQQKETEALERIIKNYFPHQIPPEVLEDFSKKANRTVFSIQAKIQKMKKKIQNENEMVFIKNEEIKMENNHFTPNTNDKEILEMPETEDFMLTEHSNIFSVSNPTNLGKRNKYDISLENMIKKALGNFPQNMATKREITEKMEEMFFTKTSKADIKWKMSTAQLLASNKNFKKIKGTYSLNERNLTKDSLNLLNLSNIPKNELNMKQKLIISLNKMPGKKGNITEIADFYMKFYKEKDLCNDEKKVKTSIQKVLKTYAEFDSSQSKTYYLLNGDS